MLSSLKELYKLLTRNELLKCVVLTARPQHSAIQKVDSTIHQITFYPLDSAIDFLNTFPLDNDLFGG